MTETMLAGRMNYDTKTFEVKRIPIPVAGVGQIRVRIKAAGVCLSDVHLIDGSLGVPTGGEVTLGHEVAGEVDQVGEGVEEVTIGTRVILNAGRTIEGRLETLGVDYDGGWAEYIVTDVEGVLPIPDSLPFEQAAVIPDAVSTPWGAIEWTGNVQAAEAAGVWGIGGLGAHAVQLLRFVGASPIVAIDPSETARQRALQLGADLALDPSDLRFGEQVETLTNGEGLAVAFDFAGVASARRQAIKSLGFGGRLVVVGMDGGPIVIEDDLDFHFTRRQVLGHYGYESRHIQQLVQLVDRGRVDLTNSVSLELPLSEAADAVKLLQQQPGHHTRIVLVP